MEKITSFTIDHLKLLPGLYVSRKDHAGDSVITTFDIRMTRPNHEPVMNTAEILTDLLILPDHPVMASNDHNAHIHSPSQSVISILVS